MKKFRWQLLIVFITALVVGVILFFQQNQPRSETEATPSPNSGGTYTEALVGNFLRLNPMLDHFNQVDRDVNRLLFSSIIRFDSTGLPHGDLAESWTVSVDGTVFTVNLRLDAVWHDGVPVTSQDVIYTISLMQGGSNLIPEDLRSFWSRIAVHAISDSSLEFALPVAYAPFLDYLSFQILPAHILGNLDMDGLVDHSFNLSPIGTGPYRFDSLETENGIITGVNLVASEFYYDGRPFIDEIHFRYYPDERAALQAYQAGEVDGLSQVGPEILQEVLNQTGLNLYSSREPVLSMVFLNLRNARVPVLQQADFRKALMSGVNRQAIIDNVLSSQAVLAQGPIIPGNWAYYDEQTAYRFDPDGARQSLLGMGLTQDANGRFMYEGTAVELSLAVQDDAKHVGIGQMLQQNWQSIGILINLQTLPYEQLLAALQERTYEMVLIDVDLSDTPDPDPYQFWAESQTESGQNYSQWANSTASTYLEQARQTTTIDIRIKLYRNFQVLFEEELPSLPLFSPVYNYAVKDSIKNLAFGPIYDPADRFNDVQGWYILTGVEQE